MITSSEYFKWKNKSRNKLATGEAYARLNIKTKNKKGNQSFKNNSNCQKMSFSNQSNKGKDKSSTKDKIKDKDIAIITNPKTGIQKAIPLLKKSLPIDKLKNSNKLMMISNSNSISSGNHISRLYLNSKHQLISSGSGSGSNNNIQSQFKKSDDSFIQTERLSKPYTIEDYHTKLPSLMNKKIHNPCSSINTNKQRYKEILSYSQTDRCNNRSHNYATNDNPSSIKIKKTKHIISLSIDNAITKQKFNVSDCNMNNSLLDSSQTITFNNPKRIKKSCRPLSRTMHIKKSSKGNNESKNIISNNDYNNSDINAIKQRPSTSLSKKLNTSLNNNHRSMRSKETLKTKTNTNIIKPLIQVCKRKSNTINDASIIKNESLIFVNNDMIDNNPSSLDQPLSSRISKSTNITSNENLIADNNTNNNNKGQLPLFNKKIIKVASISKTGFSGIGTSKVNQDRLCIDQTQEEYDCFFIW